MEAERASEIARHWINGEWVSSTKIGDSLNPSTGQVLGVSLMAAPKKRRSQSRLLGGRLMRACGLRIGPCEPPP